MSKVIQLNDDSIVFDDGIILKSYHEYECCESHYLSFKDLTLDNFEGLEFDLLSYNFFDRIEDYGIALKPLVGNPIRIPGYGRNNGYYSSKLDLVLEDEKGFSKVFDITNCQVIKD